MEQYTVTLAEGEIEFIKAAAEKRGISVEAFVTLAAVKLAAEDAAKTADKKEKDLIK